MSRRFVQGAVIALIFLFVGVATAAGVLAFIPNPGSPPSIYDDFNWSSTANGFWHVNAIGAKATIKKGLLTLSGHEIELDRRVQTDPYETVIVAKVRARFFDKFALGLGVYHSGTVSLEFDSDGLKCGRGTDVGWKVDWLQGWQSPPYNRWFYLQVIVRNPYPYVTVVTKSMKKKVTLICSAYDQNGRPIATERPVFPPPNGNYPGFDEAYLRTWDSNNDYQVDWFYAGPPSGNPLNAIAKR